MILHILSSAVHSIRFVEFMKENFDLKFHKFVYVRPDVCKYGLSNFEEVEHINTFGKQLKLAVLMNQATKIILHGLWRHEVIRLLYFQPWLLKKCYWVLWGGDYCLGKESYSKRHNFILQNVGHLISMAGDYKYVQKEYGYKGKVFYSNSFYASNIFQGDLSIANNGSKTIFLIGNSGDSLNHHKEILESLRQYRNQEIELICPLSYCATKEYQQEIISYARNLFGDKFKPLLDFMPLKEYLEILKRIDIALFAHKNQQAYGNIIQLLGMGKKVYIRKTTSWEILQNNGFIIFDFDSQITLEKLNETQASKNHRLAKEIYSYENMKREFIALFEGGE